MGARATPGTHERRASVACYNTNSMFFHPTRVVSPREGRTAMSPDRSFGTLLRQFRQAAGLSQEQLAERAGLTAKAIGALERGERQHPYPQTLQALAQALGLADAERQTLFGAVHRREGTAEPAPQPATPAALPPTPMPLLGRAADAAAVTQLLLQAPGRLLTITGPGGVGKTRLAIHVSAGLAEHFPGGVVFVELAPLADGALVLPSLAAALDIRATAGQSLETLLQRRLAAPTLVVFDNIEHLLDAVPAIAALLASCASLRLLATSRVRLHLTGEQEYPLAPLALPRLDTLPDRTTAAASPAVQLFVQHARAVARWGIAPTWPTAWRGSRWSRGGAAATRTPHSFSARRGRCWKRSARRSTAIISPIAG
jgi:transcriptional regulator with XRE-family HTH domain